MAVPDHTGADREDIRTQKDQNQNKAENSVRLSELRVSLECIKFRPCFTDRGGLCKGAELCENLSAELQLP